MENRTFRFAGSKNRTHRNRNRNKTQRNRDRTHRTGDTETEEDTYWLNNYDLARESASEVEDGEEEVTFDVTSLMDTH